MNKGNVNKERLSALMKGTDDDIVKAVCHTLLGENKEAISILKAESEKRFSRVDGCLRWPALSGLQTELRAIREDLIKRKRTIADCRREN